MNLQHKVNIKELARQIKAQLGTGGDLDINLNKIEAIIQGLIKAVSDSLKEKKSVFITGFGAFLIQKRKATRRHNPQNGKEVLIPERNVVKFRVFETFSDEVFGK